MMYKCLCYVMTGFVLQGHICDCLNDNVVLITYPHPPVDLIFIPHNAKP